MKKILITGAGSFVGTSVQNYLKKFSDRYLVEIIGTVNDEWETTINRYGEKVQFKRYWLEEDK